MSKQVMTGMRDESKLCPLPPLLHPEQSMNYVNPATAYGTYQRMAEVRSLDSITSGGSNGTKYGCYFDPGAKSGRVLVMVFDRKGRPTLKEMSRHDVLCMTQDAAKPKETLREGSVSPDSKAMSPLIRSATFGKSRNFGQQHRSLSQQELHAVSVQRVHSRDIRKMENAFSVTNEPRVIIRRQAILISADPLRAIVMRNQCLVYIPDGADILLSILKAKFAETAPENDAPFEFRALEALLATLSCYFQSQYEHLSPVGVAALNSLVQGGLKSQELEKLREFKNTVNEFEAQVDGVRRALMVLLDNEEDLRLLYLTRLYDEPNLLADLRGIDSEEIEVLIENYLQDIFSTRTKANLLQHRILNTESFVMMQLDSMRNYLLGVDLIFSIIVISCSFGTFVAGVFGMNLHSGYETAGGWFWGVALFTVLLFLGTFVVGVLYFKSKGVLL